VHSGQEGQARLLPLLVVLPGGDITKTVPLQIDLEYCKGCGICAEVCPTHAIAMVDEEKFIS